MSKLLGIIIIGWALVAMACGSNNSNIGVIELQGEMIGVGMWTEHTVQGRACVRPRENTMHNPDGSMLLLTA